MSTNKRPPLGDDDVTRLLVRRADRRLDEQTRGDVVQEVLQRAGPERSRSFHGGWRMPAYATAVAVIAVLVVSVMGLNLGAPSLTAGPSTVPGPTPAPLAASVLSTVSDLRNAIAQVTVGGPERDLVVDASLDMASVRNRFGVFCASDTPCPVGYVAGTQDLVLSALRNSDLARAIASQQDTLPGPLAVHINANGRLDLLGLLTRTDADVPWPASARAVSSLESGQLWTVIAVHGFLVWSGPVPCPGPAYGQPTPPPGGPFDTCPWAWITQEAYQPWHGNSMSPPPAGIKVQWEAYNDFVPAAQQQPLSGGGYQPVEGTYLLRLVADPRPSANPNRGWQVVGRLDSSANTGPEPTASPGASASTFGDVLTADELGEILQQTPITAVDVVANVSVETNVTLPVPGCTPGGQCPSSLGVIRELGNVMVYRSPDDPYPELTTHDLSAPIALRIGPDASITFLGHVDLNGETGLSWTVPTAGPILKSIPFGDVLAVDDWLSRYANINEPALPPALPPFNLVFTDVLSPTSADPPQVSGWVSNGDFIRIQRGSYAAFAPGDHVSGNTPVFGTYLVQHVANPNAICPDCDGWLMVGRLANAAAPVGTPLPSPTAATIPVTLGQTVPLLPTDSALQDPSLLAVGTTANVTGWLVDDGPAVPCPTIVSPTAPPADIWEPSCYGGAWITRDEVQPVTSFGNGFSVKVPPDAVRVQPDAYYSFAPDPAFEADQVRHVPQAGTYTLELIRDPRFPDNGALGWQIVGRVSPKRV